MHQEDSNREKETFLAQSKEVFCQKHMKEIKFIDISAATSFGNRALCEDCEPQGRQVPIQKAMQTAKNFESREIFNNMRDFILKQEENHQGLILSLNYLKNRIENLNDFFKKLSVDIDPIIHIYKEHLTLSKMCYLGEIIALSQNRGGFQNIEKHFLQQINLQNRDLLNQLEEVKKWTDDAINNIQMFSKVQDTNFINKQAVQVDEKNLSSQQISGEIKHSKVQMEIDSKIIFSRFNTNNENLFLVREKNFVQIIDVQLNRLQESIICSEVEEITLFNVCPNQNDFVVGDRVKLLIYEKIRDFYQKKEILVINECQDCFLDYYRQNEYSQKLFVLKKNEINIYVKNKNQTPCYWKKNFTINHQESNNNFCINQQGILAFGLKQLLIFYEKNQELWVQIETKLENQKEESKIAAICQKDMTKKIITDFKYPIFDLRKQYQKFNHISPIGKPQQKILEEKINNLIYITLQEGKEIKVCVWQFLENCFQIIKQFKYNLDLQMIAIGEDKILTLSQQKQLFLMEYEKETLSIRSKTFSKTSDYFSLSNKSGSCLAQVYKNSFEIIYFADFESRKNKEYILTPISDA